MNKELSTQKANTGATSQVSYRRPAYRVETLEDAYEIRVQVPGCSKEGISISHEKDTLSIQASRRDAVDAGWKVLHREYRESDFELKLNLNVNINAEKISAKTQDGVLTVRLPVAEQAKPRMISVE